MRRLLVIPLVSALVGCGAQGAEPPDLASPGPDIGGLVVDLPQAGVRFQGPQAWRQAKGQAPLVVTLQAGTATIAVWRYPRTEPLPTTRAALVAAKESLVAETKRRDPTFRVDTAGLLTVGGARAIQVLGTGRIDGRERRVRSTHAFANGAEIVIDAYARAEDFPRMDERVISPLLGSLKITKPKA